MEIILLKGFVVQSTAGISISGRLRFGRCSSHVDFQLSHQAMLHNVRLARRAFASSNFRRASGRGRRRFPRCFDALRAPAYFLLALGPVLGLSAANGCSPFQQLDNLGSIAGVFDLAA